MQTQVSGSVLPNTENTSVATLAVAWEIVLASYDLTETPDDPDEQMKELTNAVIKVYTAINTGKPLE